MYQLRTGIARDRAHKVADPVWERAIQVYAGQAMEDEQHARDDWRRFSKDDKAA